VIEFSLDERGRFFVAIEVRLLAGHFQVAAAREVTVDVFFASDCLDAIDRLKRRRIHFADDFDAIAFDRCRHRQLHAGKDHAAVTGAGAPTECFGFEYGDVHSAFCERARRGEAAVAAADHSDLNGIGEFGRGGDGRRIDSSRPEIFLLNGHGMNWRGKILALRSGWKTVIGMDKKETAANKGEAAVSMSGLSSFVELVRAILRRRLGRLSA